MLLRVSVMAFAALGAWQVADAFNSGNDNKGFVKSAGKAVLNAALAFTTAAIALGSGGSNGDSQSQGFASSLMSAPAGRLLAGVVGVVGAANSDKAPALALPRVP